MLSTAPASAVIPSLEVRRLKDIPVPDRFYKRIDIGVPVLNEMFGGTDMPGIMPGSTVLFTGEPGAGKSTMALQLADLMASRGKNVLVNSLEEAPEIVAMRGRRLKLEGNFDLAAIPQVDDVIKLVRETGVEVLLQDSLQTSQDGSLEGNRMMVSVISKLQAASKELGLTLIMVGHVTKGGVFAGPNKIKHEVDAHAHLRTNRDTGDRQFQFEKNRFGPAWVPYEFSVTSNGIDFRQVTTEQQQSGNDGPSAGRGAERRERIVDFIKDQLLTGDKISGYCFERYVHPAGSPSAGQKMFDVSGGFWRGMLARAVEELKREGHTINEELVNGRRHAVLTVKAPA